MSRPVDVLAVMDAVQAQLDRSHGVNSFPELAEARAAVAELVEAVRALDAAYIKHDDVRDNHTLSAAFRHDVGRQLVAAIDRKDAALAKFGGAA